MRTGAYEVLYGLMDELEDQCYVASCSECESPAIHKFASAQVKDRLLEACTLFCLYAVVCLLSCFEKTL